MVRRTYKRTTHAKLPKFSQKRPKKYISKRKRVYRSRNTFKAAMPSSTHTITIQSMALPLTNNAAVDQASADAFGVQLYPNGNMNPAYDTIVALLQLSNKHYGIESSPLTITLGRSDPVSLFANINNAIINKHRSSIGSMKLGTVAAQKGCAISYKGIKIKQIHPLPEQGKNYVPTCAVQLASDGPLDIITFVKGSLYIKCVKGASESYQGAVGQANNLQPVYNLNLGLWPNQLILNNLKSFKVKVYYRHISSGYQPATVENRVNAQNLPPQYWDADVSELLQLRAMNEAINQNQGALAGLPAAVIQAIANFNALGQLGR